jgi:excisionase family DNA binding protein
MPSLMTKAEAAEALRCSIRQIDRLRQNGSLPYQKFGSHIRFLKSNVESLLKPAPAKSWIPVRMTADANELPPSILRPIRKAEFVE